MSEAPKPPRVAPDTIAAIMAQAAIMLQAAGFKLVYRSRHGASWYFTFEGRAGLLRLSDHARHARDDG